MSKTDRIEKQILLHAPRTRVWRALTSSAEFGQWFGARWSGEFVVGAHVRGNIVGHGSFEGLPIEITIERMEPERIFSYRWHPYAVDRDADYSKEPTTLVVFELADAEGGTRLTVVESGFDGIPLARRAKAFEMNTEGWGIQLERIARYVAEKR